MSKTSGRQVNIQVSGDGINRNDTFPAASNTSANAVSQSLSLASGSNTITTTTGFVAVTIIPPAGNTNSITLKGVTGDTGIRLHNTDPSSIGLDSSVSSFVLTATTTINGVLLVWS